MEKHLTWTRRRPDEILYQPFLFTIAWQMLSDVRTNPIARNYGQSGGLTQPCTCREAAATTTFQRCYTHRYELKAPSAFCPIHSPFRNTNGHQAKSINMSSRGIYFVTDHPIFVGLPVQVLLRMPRRTARTLPSERIFTGRVSDVEWKDVPSESPRVGVEFFYWQTQQMQA
jgi:hypothetical protein